MRYPGLFPTLNLRASAYGGVYSFYIYSTLEIGVFTNNEYDADIAPGGYYFTMKSGLGTEERRPFGATSPHTSPEFGGSLVFSPPASRCFALSRVFETFNVTDYNDTNKSVAWWLPGPEPPYPDNYQQVRYIVCAIPVFGLQGNPTSTSGAFSVIFLLLCWKTLTSNRRWMPFKCRWLPFKCRLSLCLNNELTSEWSEFFVLGFKTSCPASMRRVSLMHPRGKTLYLWRQWHASSLLCAELSQSSCWISYSSPRNPWHTSLVCRFPFHFVCASPFA